MKVNDASMVQVSGLITDKTSVSMEGVVRDCHLP